MLRRIVVSFWPATLVVAVFMYWLQLWGCRHTMRRVQAWMAEVMSVAEEF